MKVSITEIRKYIANRFQEYAAIGNVLDPPPKQKFELKPPRPAEITAGAAITDGGEASAGRGDEGGAEEQGEEEYDDEEYNEEHESDEVSRPVDKTYPGILPNCLFCRKKGMTADHWMSDCKKVKASSKLKYNRWVFAVCVCT